MEIQEHHLILSLVGDLTNTKMKVVNLHIRKKGFVIYKVFFFVKKVIQRGK